MILANLWSSTEPDFPPWSSMYSYGAVTASHYANNSCPPDNFSSPDDQRVFEPICVMAQDLWWFPAQTKWVWESPGCSHIQQRIQVGEWATSNHMDLSAVWQELWFWVGGCRSSDITVLLWEQCWPLFGCGAPPRSVCKRHRSMSHYKSDAFDGLPRSSKAPQTSHTAVVKMQIQCSIQWNPKHWHI